MAKKQLEQDFAAGEKKFEHTFEYRFPEGLKPMAESEARLDQWFRDAKFGAFIHFGLYSQLAGMYKGKVSKHRYSEWIYLAAGIPAEEYRQLADTFDPEEFDADEWARVFKAAGMRYVVMGAKHHEGFALFKSEASAFNVVDGSPFKRDIIRELADACVRHGLKFGIYYSYAQDWDDPNSSFDARFHQRDIHPDLPADFEPDMDRYLAEKALPQVDELLKNYPIDLLWFDTPKGMTFERTVQLRDTIRKHRPDCLINSRILTWGIGRIEQENLELFDYVSIGDLEVPDRKLPVYFESPDSVGSFYGYKAHGDYSYHTPKELIDRMVRTICAGGNYLLNNGPMGNGLLDPEAVRLYGIIGEWMRHSGESLLDTRANPFDAAPEWGDLSVNQAGDVLYAHILEWPESGTITLEAQVVEAVYLANSEEAQFEQDGEIVVFSLPPEPANEYDTVIKLRLKVPVKGDP